MKHVYLLVLALFFYTSAFGQKDKCKKWSKGFNLQGNDVFMVPYAMDTIPKIGKIESSSTSFEIRYYFRHSFYGTTMMLLRCVEGKIEAIKIYETYVSDSDNRPVAKRSFVPITTAISTKYFLKPEFDLKD
jgi:hypothetical protein